MATVWKLQGGTVSTATEVATLGLSNLVRTRRSLALDELRFRASGALVDSTALFAFGDEVVLTRTVDAGSPVVWFRGRCVQVPRRGDARAEELDYLIAGPWWYAENLVFQQIWPLDSSANSHLSSPTTYRRALVIAGLASSTGLRQDTKAFVQDVLDWLIAANSPAAPVLQYTAANLPTGFQVPFTRLDSPTSAEALQHIARWMPDAASWFDYTTTPPTFNLKRRSGASTVSYAITDLVQVDLVPRTELKLEKLIIQFVTLNASGLVVLNEDKDPTGAGTTGKEWGAAVFTIDNNYLPLPTGLAANYRSGLSTLQYAGRIIIEERECSQAVTPGTLVNITGGLTAWATMAAQVQEVVEEIDEGRTSITLGPPSHIRLDDLVEVLKIARNQSDQFGGSGEILKSGKQAKSQVLTQAITVAGVVPTSAEIVTAIEAAYSGKPAPRSGDIVHLTVGGVVKFRVYVHTLSSTTSGAFVVSFSVSSVTYYGHVHQTGIY
jgi:hypothetical protein